MFHLFSFGSKNFCIDTNSSAVHLLDDAACAVLSLFHENTSVLEENCPAFVHNSLDEIYGYETVSETYAELYELYQKGLLMSPDTYEKLASMLAPAPIKSMCLNVAHDCNLRCKYCFASQGDFGGERCLMPFEVAKAAIDFLIENSVGRHNLELDFFGGEPLMNITVVKQTVAYARSIEKEKGKNFRFTVTTNGVLLDDESIDFINQEMSNVVLSLDGRREINDLLRPTANGKGSYDLIVPKYQRLVEKRAGKQYYLRGTFTKYNLDFASDVLHFADDLGFKSLSIEPAVLNGDLPFALDEGDRGAIFAEYNRLAEIILERGGGEDSFKFFHFLIDLEKGPCALKRLRGCSCGNEYVAVTPNGDIYPCHQFVGEEQFIMGNVLDGYYDKEKKLEYSKANVYAKEKCRGCWAKFFCSGGCNANNYHFNGDILKPHDFSCDLEQKRIECAIAIHALSKIPH